MAHNRKDKEHEIIDGLKVGRNENGFNYYIIVKGRTIELTELDVELLHSRLDDLLYYD